MHGDELGQRPECTWGQIQSQSYCKGAQPLQHLGFSLVGIIAEGSPEPCCTHTSDLQTTRVINTASLVAQPVNSLPAMQQTQVQSLGEEDPLEKRMATHSSILAWKILWMEEPGGLPSMGSHRVGHN